MEEKMNVNVDKLRAVITKSAGGEVFDALFAGDLNRIKTSDESKKIELATKSVVRTLAFYLAGNGEAVASVFKQSELAKVSKNAAEAIVSACSELTSVYNKADSFYDGYEIVDPVNTPAGNKICLGLCHVEDWLKSHNVEARFNLMTQSVEITGYTERVLQSGGLLNTLPTIIYDDLCNYYKGCSADMILSYLRVIAEAHPYHPVIDLLKSTTWDGKSRFNELFGILGIDFTDNLSKTLFKKWMKQSIAMLHNGENNTVYGAEGVLTLSGAQGIGKTTLLRCLAIDRAFFREGQRLDDRDKDTARRCITTWIAELGELDCTLKSDLGYLKAFITADVDSYRLPYGRADITMPRRASLAASVNGDSFLVDPTGNRRFWVIELEKIDVDAVLKFDFLQLWKEVESEMNSDYQSFRLTASEQEALANRNKTVERGLKGEAEIVDILATGGNFDWITLATFKETFGVLRSYNTESIGKVLIKLGIEKKQKRINGSKVPTRVYYLPTQINTTVNVNNNIDDEKDVPWYND